LNGDKPLARGEVLALAIALEGGLLILAIGAGWLVSRPPLRLIDLTWPAAGLGVAATIPLLILLAWSLGSKLPALERLRREVYDVLLPLLANCSVPDIAAISLVAGVGEEALFRGLLQTGIGEAAGPWVGLVAASILFGLAHFVTPTYALLAGLVGAYLGWLFAASANLLVPITVHSVYDFVALTFLIRGHQNRYRNERPFGKDCEV
jgi:membrane protease YdiL (CAAX protease family)